MRETTKVELDRIWSTLIQQSQMWLSLYSEQKIEERESEVEGMQSCWKSDFQEVLPLRVIRMTFKVGYKKREGGTELQNVTDMAVGEYKTGSFLGTL